MEKLDAITQEQWNSVNPKNKKMVEDYLSQSMQLSDYTLNQYTSALKIYFYWVKENCDDKGFWQLKSRDFLSYQNYLSKRGLSSSAIKFKRSSISSFNNYILLYYLDEYPDFRQYITKAIQSPPSNFVNEKEPLTLQEYEKLCSELENREMWQELAYLRFSFSTGARRNEVKQLLKEVVNYEPKISEVIVKNDKGESEVKQSRSYITHDIRCKGRGKLGKVRKLQFDQLAMNAIKKWLDFRGEDNCPYVFVGLHNGIYSQISETTFNAWTSKAFTKIVGRRVHPHLFRESRATSLVVEQGFDIKVAQKLLGHQSSTTTEIYVIEKNKEDSDEAFL